jgi:hypothetical protein
MSPLQRTLAFLRKEGYIVGITEKWNPHAHIRQDFCGFADCLAFTAGVKGVLAVNAMLLRNRNVHDKFNQNEALRVWLEAGNRFAMFQWHKIGPRGKRKIWKVQIVHSIMNEKGLVWTTSDEVGA